MSKIYKQVSHVYNTLILKRNRLQKLIYDGEEEMSEKQYKIIESEISSLEKEIEKIEQSGELPNDTAEDALSKHDRHEWTKAINKMKP